MPSIDEVSFEIPPNKVIDGDTLKPGPDGHIRHPKDDNLVWWEFQDGSRHWVRQNRWEHFQDVKTEAAPDEIYHKLPSWQAKAFKRRCREDGIRYKVRPCPYTDWNAEEGPWEVPGD
jgi:hypothetical protein